MANQEPRQPSHPTRPAPTVATKAHRTAGGEASDFGVTVHFPSTCYESESSHAMLSIAPRSLSWWAARGAGDRPPPPATPSQPTPLAEARFKAATKQFDEIWAFYRQSRHRLVPDLLLVPHRPRRPTGFVATKAHRITAYRSGPRPHATGGDARKARPQTWLRIFYRCRGDGILSPRSRTLVGESEVGMTSDTLLHACTSFKGQRHDSRSTQRSAFV